MIVFAVHEPHLVRHSGGIRTERVILALDIDDALALLFVLADHVAEDAALALVVPLVGGVEFVLDAPGDEDGGGDLGMGVGPLVTGEHALILEYSDVFEARI